MGVLLDGHWRTEGLESRTDGEGRFQRAPSRFRERVGETARHPLEHGRYRLIVSLACPWAHRTLIMRKLKGLETCLPIWIVDPIMGDDGWEFSGHQGTTTPDISGARFLREIYVKADRHATGPVTVPVLWDETEGLIVNNESSEILRLMNEEFALLSGPSESGLEDHDFYPESLRGEIGRLNQTIYDRVNNGVYLCGFARSQDAYDRAFRTLFTELDRLDRLLAERPFLAGDTITEADLRLFTTLFRFDAVYYGHFKCNFKRLIDYDHLWPYARMIYQIPGVRETCDLHHIKEHYYRSHPHLNPSRIVPQGPWIDFDEPHDRPVPQGHGGHAVSPPSKSTAPILSSEANAPHIEHGP